MAACSSQEAPASSARKFVRRLAERRRVTRSQVLDKLTLRRQNRANLEGCRPRLSRGGNIADPEAGFARAAKGLPMRSSTSRRKTHVDRSILGPAEFILTDIHRHPGCCSTTRRQHQIRPSAGVDRRGLRATCRSGRSRAPKKAPIPCVEPRIQRPKAGGDLQVLAVRSHRTKSTRLITAPVAKHVRRRGNIPRKVPLPLFITNAFRGRVVAGLR